MRNFFNGTHRKPSWRKARHDEGFRIVAVKPGHVRKLNRAHAKVLIPKLGWVRFRLSRPVPGDVKSFRVTRDAAGRWHIAFAHVPGPLPGPGTGEVVGVDRGVAVTLALSDGTTWQAPAPRPVARLQRKMARAGGAAAAAPECGSSWPAPTPAAPTRGKTGRRRPALRSRSGTT